LEVVTPLDLAAAIEAGEMFANGSFCRRKSLSDLFERCKRHSSGRRPSLSGPSVMSGSVIYGAAKTAGRS
jgi:hypothetical protein